MDPPHLLAFSSSLKVATDLSFIAHQRLTKLRISSAFGVIIQSPDHYQTTPPAFKMAGPPKKRQRREAKEDGSMPQKKYYRQRAHANPFSDHDLT